MCAYRSFSKMNDPNPKHVGEIMKSAHLTIPFIFYLASTLLAQSTPRSLFDGQTLTGWIVPNLGTQGEVSVKDSCLVLGYGDGCTAITWTGEFPTTRYIVTLEAMRVDGNDFFCGMTFPVMESPCTLIIGGWGGTIVGLSSIDGQDAADNQTSSYEKFDNGRWYRIRLRVTEQTIQAWINDKNYVDFEINDHKLSIRREVADCKPFGFASWKTTAALRRICVRTLP